MESPNSRIVDAIARRRSVIVIGSGVSAQSKDSSGRRPPTWRAFLERALGQLPTKEKRGIKKHLSKGDYLTACELVRMRMGSETFHDFLKSEFLNAFEPSELHKEIFRLDSRIVVTPNFDKIYDSYVSSESSGSIMLKTYEDADVVSCLRGDDRLVLKLHGTIDSPSKLIFSRSDYCKARIKCREFYSFIEALALTHTFIFLGCGVSDPDISLMLEDLFSKFPHAHRHYMTLPSNEISKDEEEIFTSLTNVNLIKYNPAGGHRALVDWVINLNERVEQRRDELSASRNW